MAKLWTATLDELTCDYCAGMDGMVIRNDETWVVAPGDVHMHCRCEEFDLDVLVAALGLGILGSVIADQIDEGWEQNKGGLPAGDYEDTPSWLYDAQYAGGVPDGVMVDGGTETNYSAYMVWN